VPRGMDSYDKRRWHPPIGMVGAAGHRRTVSLLIPAACNAEQPTKPVGLIDFIRVRCHAATAGLPAPSFSTPGVALPGRVKSVPGEAGHMQGAALTAELPDVGAQARTVACFRSPEGNRS
jgi:hypothetical protein